MRVYNLNWRTLWMVAVILLLLTEECKGQSSTGGRVNIVAVIVAVVIILIILCITMPICIICLTVALCCTCRQYKKKRKETEPKTAETTTIQGTPSIANLPLPPIPTADGTTTILNTNEAYGANMVEPPPTYESQLYMTIDQEGHAQSPRQPELQLPSTTAESATVMHGNEAYGVKPDVDVSMDTNEAYGSKQEEYELATPSAPPAAATVQREEKMADGRKQLPDGTDYYNYYDYI